MLVHMPTWLRCVVPTPDMGPEGWWPRTPVGDLHWKELDALCRACVHVHAQALSERDISRAECEEVQAEAAECSAAEAAATAAWEAQRRELAQRHAAQVCV